MKNRNGSQKLILFTLTPALWLFSCSLFVSVSLSLSHTHTHTHTHTFTYTQETPVLCELSTTETEWHINTLCSNTQFFTDSNTYVSNISYDSVLFGTNYWFSLHDKLFTFVLNLIVRFLLQLYYICPQILISSKLWNSPSNKYFRSFFINFGYLRFHVIKI